MISVPGAGVWFGGGLTCSGMCVFAKLILVVHSS